MLASSQILSSQLGYPEGLTVEPVEVRLRRNLEQKRREVKDLEAALALLEKQPQLLETLNLLRKVGI